MKTQTQPSSMSLGKLRLQR